MGEVDDAPPDKGSAVVDADMNPFAVVQIVDPDHSREGQGPVGRRHGMHVVDFPVAGPFPVEGVAVPGGKSRRFRNARSSDPEIPGQAPGGDFFYTRPRAATSPARPTINPGIDGRTNSLNKSYRRRMNSVEIFGCTIG